MADTGFDFQKFIDDSKKALMAPKEYFASMPKEGGFVEPLIKALIYGVTAGVIYLIYGFLNLTVAVGLEAVGPVKMFISIIIAAIIGLFIGGVIMLIISAICTGSTNYEANVRATAAMAVLMPINALLSFTYGISLSLGMIVGIIVGLYGIWLMYNALVSALGAKEGRAKIVALVITALIVISQLSSLMCSKAAKSLSDKALQDPARTEQEMNKALDIWKKAAEDAKKAAEAK